MQSSPSDPMEVDGGPGRSTKIDQGLKGEMKSPKILDITWKDRSIIITWEKAEGAESTVLKIFNEKKILEHTTLNLVYFNGAIELPMQHSYRYGHTCTFVFEAKDRYGKIKKATQTELIGGSKVVQNLKIIGKGSRWIKASWDPPQDKPTQYQVQIYEMVSGKATNVGGQIELQIKCSHIFMKLKTETSYFCEVCPVYGLEPSYSSITDIAITDRREEDPIENNLDFGKTESISVKILDGQLQRMTANIMWSHVRSGQNYEVMKYDVQLKSTSWFGGSPQLQMRDQLSRSVIVKDMILGEEYKVTLTTFLRDLDTYCLKKCDKHIIFKTDPRRTVLLDHCNWTDEAVTFFWLAVPGAVCYDLILRDEIMKDQLESKLKISANSQNEGSCSASIPMSQRVRMGQTCTANVVTHAQNGLEYQSDWKTFLIGNDDHPRNVKVIRNRQDPIRSVVITFDPPRHGNPKEYKIVAVPETGTKKTCYTMSSPFVFKYLRSNTLYTFEVSAKWINTFCNPSASNKVRTMKNDAPIMNSDDVRTSASNVKESHTVNAVLVSNDLKGGTFGMVRNIKIDVEPNGEADICHIRWYVPSFGDRSVDYKVEFYKVYIQRGQSRACEYKVEFKEGETDYSENVYLSLGGEYEVTVETRYEDIDSNEIHQSGCVKSTVYTRPCKPTITQNAVASDKLKLAWNAVTGAMCFWVSIFINGSSCPSIEVRSVETSYEREFDHILGYGKSYKVKITAVSKGGSKNQSSTEEKVIGGDYVPTNVLATNYGVSDPSTEVFLRWIEPKISPKSYEIEAHSENNPVIRQSVDKIDSYLFENLKGGTVYVFKVMAIHADVHPCRITGGSPSNEVTTSPRPMQVKNVWAKLGLDPMSFEIYWDKIEVLDDALNYQVHLKARDYTIKRMNILKNHTCVSGLQPGTDFTVAVSAYNSEGFGEESDDFHISTKMETPKGVTLQNNSECRTTSLHLNFQPTKSKAIAYLCKMYKHQYQQKLAVGERFQIYECSHKISNLEPNQEYQVEVSALFVDGESDGVLSNKLKTGPDKTEIETCECYMDEQNGSRQIFVRWKSCPGINYHEVKFMKQSSGEVENILSVERENEIVYSCRYESIDYSVQVRPRNDSTIPIFGDWSNQKYVSLAPAKLDGIKAETKEDGNIVITCSPALGHSPLYFMDVVCNGNLLPGEPIKSDDVSHDIVKWIYTPNQYAREYQFRLWAQYSSKIKGQITTSDKVTSKPAGGEITDLTVSPDRRSTDIVMSWKELENCEYQIKICDSQGNEETKFISAKLTHNYRCQIAGSKYKVFVRGVRNSVQGNWSEAKSIVLAPDKVELPADHHTANKAIEFIDLRWNKLRASPDGYHVKLCCDDKVILEQRCPRSSESMHFKAPQVEPGRLYHCEVAGFNEAGYGEYTCSKIYHIGNDKHPRNISVTANIQDPVRSVVIMFDQPRYGNSEEYRIVAVPEQGRRKTCYTKTSPFTFKYLRSNTLYTFEVTAKWNNVFGDPSKSNEICTMEIEGSGCPGMQVSHSSTGNIDQGKPNVFDVAASSNDFKGADFGIVENITIDLEPNGTEDKCNIRWSAPSFGGRSTDYKVQLYKVYIQRGQSEADEYEVEFKEDEIDYSEAVSLDLGGEYDVSVETYYEGIDNDEVHRIKCDKLTVYTRPCQPIITQNLLALDKLQLEWDPVTGAESYLITIFVDGSSSATIKDRVERNCYERGFDHMLGYGNSYKAKITALGKGGNKNSSFTKEKIIGSDKHPRNVKVIRNSQDPIRSVVLTFDQPRHGNPEEYKIVAVPETGSKKTRYTKSSPFTFKYLRSNTLYTFEVSAKWNDAFGDPSNSMEIRTMKNDASGNPMVNVSGVETATIDMREAQILNVPATSNNMKSDDFGMVRNINKTVVESDGGKDTCNIRWSTPSFGYRSVDYKVEFYQIYIQRGQSRPQEYKVEFKEGETDYSKNVPLDPGVEYEVSVETHYEDIDGDEMHRSACAKLTVYSRPCKPTITENSQALGKLKLKWKPVTGAERFVVAIFIDGSSSAEIVDHAEKNCYETELGHILGYGKSYKAEIIALGKGGTKNSSFTEETVIAMETPKDVTLQNDSDHHTTALLLKFQPIRSRPVAYVCKLYKHENQQKFLVGGHFQIHECSHKIPNLEPNQEYQVEVSALFEAGKSDWIPSNKLKTDFPGPQQIEHSLSYTEDGGTVEIQFQPLASQDVSKYYVRLSINDAYTETSVEGTVAIFRAIELGTRCTPSIVAKTVHGCESRREYGDTFWTKPGKVQGVKTNPESKYLEKVHWQRVQGAQSYNVRYGTDYEFNEVTQDCDFFIANLKRASTYYVQITAKNSAGPGEASDIVHFNAVLAEPQYLILEDASDENCLRLLAQWEPRENTTKYNIVLDNPMARVMEQETTNATSHMFSNLEYGKYNCKVQALEHSSLRHSSFVASKPTWTRPPQVTNLTIAVDSPTSCSLAWKEIAHASYTVRWQRANDQPDAYSTKRNKLPLGNLKCNSTYTVSVTAENDAGEGKESERLSFQTGMPEHV